MGLFNNFFLTPIKNSKYLLITHEDGRVK